MTGQRPLILISNDDGVQAPGLHRLIDCVLDSGLDADVVAVAPVAHQSGQSSAITIDTPLRIKAMPDYRQARVYAVTGTPVDCVKLGIHAALKRTPDLMLSGINHGSNSGNSTIYSGTMGAAMEACMIGVPAIGFSLLDWSADADFKPAMPFVREIIGKVMANGLPDQVCLNVNIPAGCDPLGIKITRCARGRWTEEYKEYTDPHGRRFYMLTGVYEDEQPEDPASDNYWLRRNYVTVTPIRPDQTAAGSLAAVANILDR
ncbi:MAG: 5'/3'-nucleotidase SurE [Muribaculaceae bacterium]|nr:5'/3'-nucleotidase SurE [Muribaculaceae bacterium]MDE6315282.1 5'/3'-nucleotidase SurE [Muribaculaceae bacterium]